MSSSIDYVGPVLESGAEAILEAIRELNPHAVIEERGAYVRVLAPSRCYLTREAVERRSGRPFRLPADLECVMPAFKGLIRIDGDQVVWSFEGQ